VKTVVCPRGLRLLAGHKVSPGGDVVDDLCGVKGGDEG